MLSKHLHPNPNGNRTLPCLRNRSLRDRKVVLYLVSELDLVERVLQTYSLEELMEMNNLTDYDVLCILMTHRQINYPKPVDL